MVALTWLGNRIWESENNPTIPLKTLYSLVKPSSISVEADAIHKTVLKITARDLVGQLKDVRNRHPDRPDIKPILEALEPYTCFHRTGSSSHSELESWTAGGLLGSMRSTFQSLVLWSTNSDMNMSPPSYTHRQFLAAVRLLGAPRVVAEFIEELKLQTEAGSGPLAMDIAATFICSPLTESFAVDQHVYQQQQQQQQQQKGQQQQTAQSDRQPHCPILTPRDALALQHQEIPQMAEKDPLRAQVIVRLYRRVNVLTTPSPQAPNLDLVNVDIMQSMHFTDQQQQPSIDDVGSMDMTAAPDENEHISRILDKAVAGMNVDNDLGLGGDGAGFGTADTEMGSPGGGLDTAGFDDVLNATDMAVGNPEFLDLDMDDMF